MGCVFSSRNTTTTSPSTFKVTNIDESGNEKYHGRLEITGSNLVLHKKRQPSIVWPLKTIRRYGYEDFMFCFEAGRLSPCGEGIFAFKSKNAKHIFDALKVKLETNINDTNNAMDISSEARSYSGHSYSNSRTLEDVFEEVSFYNQRCRGNSNNTTQPLVHLIDPDALLLPYTSRASFINIPSDNEDDDDDDDDDDYDDDNIINNSLELPKETLIYTEVEIAACTPKEKKNSETLPTSSAYVPSYTTIDFDRTMHLSQKMLRCSDNDGLRKTRHDSALSNL